MAITRLDLIHRAQERIGDEPIASETAPGATLYTGIFDETRDDLLSRYSWSFATVTLQLTRLDEVPGAHWKYFFQLPAEMIGAPRAVYPSAEVRFPTSRYELTENRLASDHETIWLRFSKRPEIIMWPGYFTKLHGVCMQAELALAVREDHPMYARLQEVAFGPPHLAGDGGLMAQAVASDMQSQPSRVVAEGTNPLIDARR